MTATLFLSFLAMMTVVIMALSAAYLPRRFTFRLLGGLSAWLLYVGVLSYFGVVSNMALRPPGAAYIMLPVFLFVLFLTRSKKAARIALSFPLWLLLAAQSFRIGVELLLHRLWQDGLAPQMLTYEGANVDILVGLSAPLIAWLVTRGQWGQRLALAWNVLGLLALSNVAIRSVLTAPGPLRFIYTEVPNLAVGTFPFTYIAGFFAPLAVILHVLSIRALRSRLRDAAQTASINYLPAR